MKVLLTTFDVGSYYIKALVNEVHNDKVYNLAKVCIRSKGVKNGFIYDDVALLERLKIAKEMLESEVGTKLDKCAITIPSTDRELSIVTCECDVLDEDSVISNTEILSLLEEARNKSLVDGMDIVTVIPISFHIDGKDDGVKNPKGMTGKHLLLKAVVGMVPSINIEQFKPLFKSLDMDIVDYLFSETGSYYAYKNDRLDGSVSAIVDIGYDTIKVSIYNKGIMIKAESIDVGSKKVDQDIMYMYKVNKKTARDIKENFAYATSSLATLSEKLSLKDKFDNDIIVSQKDVSSVVEERLLDMLMLVKKEISILTNRDISYIIITGGIVEMTGFKDVVSRVFQDKANVLKPKNIGLRNNLYVNLLGATRYLDEKNKLRGQIFSMVDSDIIENSFSSVSTCESFLENYLRNN